jgi:AbrB family looped-hinge helix DNA binding protein
MAVATATMTSKGQLTVPKEIRDRLGLAPGDKIEFVPGGDERTVLLRKRRVVELSELFGSLPTNGISLDVEGIDQAIGAAVLERFERSRS